MDIRHLLAQISTLLAGSYFSKGVNFLTFFILMQWLSLVDIGSLFTILSYFNIGIQVTEFGVNKILVTKIRKNPERTGILVFNGLLLRWSLSLLVTLGVILVLPFTPHSTIVRDWVPYFMASVFFVNTRLTLNALLFSQELFKPVAWLDSIQAVWNLTLMVGLGSSITIGAILWIMLSSYTLFAILTFFYVKRSSLPLQPVFDWGTTREIWSMGLPLMLSGTCHMLYYQFDMLLVSFFRGDSEAGILAIIKKITDLGLILVDACTSVAIPHLTKAFKTSEEALQKMIGYALWITPRVIIPFMCVCFFFPETLIYIAVRKEIPEALPVLATSAFFVFGVAYGMIHSGLLVILEKQWLDPAFLGTLAVSSIIGNLFLIPRFGALGAGITSAAITILYFLLAMNVTVSRPWISRFLRSGITPLAGSLLACSILSRRIVPAVAGIVGYLLVYVLILKFELSRNFPSGGKISGDGELEKEMR